VISDRHRNRHFPRSFYC